MLLERGSWEGVPVERSLAVSPRGVTDLDISPSPRVVLASDRNIADYLTSVENGSHDLPRLALDTWLMTRARAINMAYAEAVGRPTVLAAAEVAHRAWARASEAAYVGLRRWRRKRPVPDQYIARVREAVQSDVDLAARWAA